MKKIVCLLIAILLLLVCCSCSIGSNAADGKKNAAELKVDNNKNEDFKKKLSNEEFFRGVTEQVRKDWSSDAKLFKVYTIIFNSDIKKLPDLSCYDIWEANYYSPSKNKTIHIVLNTNQNPEIALSDIWYFYINSKSGDTNKSPLSAIKQDPDKNIFEEDPEDFNTYKAVSDDWYKGWKTDLKMVGQKIYDHVKDMLKSEDCMIGIRLYHSIKWVGKEINAPIWDISWKDPNGKSHYYIINASTGDTILDVNQDNFK